MNIWDSYNLPCLMLNSCTEGQTGRWMDGWSVCQTERQTEKWKVRRILINKSPKLTDKWTTWAVQE